MDGDLKQRFSYNPTKGIFIYKTGYRAGKRAGYVDVDGYRRVGNIYEHRLAWFFVHGYWPKVIGHIDRDKTHNWIDNLCDTTPAENTRHSPRSCIDYWSGTHGV